MIELPTASPTARSPTAPALALDPAQAAAWQQLTALAARLSDRPLGHPWLRWLTRQRAPRGLYLVGGVGRGKTLLMDRFVQLCGTHVLRLHFHRFMQAVHTRLHALNQGQWRDPLKIVAREYAHQFTVLCLDDLWISDITDAMLVGGLLQHLNRAGVSLVITSNMAPADLYPNGLQRARFLPTIALLERITATVWVDAGIDYRTHAYGQNAWVFIGPDANQALHSRYQHMTQHDALLPTMLTCQGRALHALAQHSDSLLIDFAELCRGNRATSDYIELTNRFKFIGVTSVPLFVDADIDPLRRFIAFIDECYDRKRFIALACQTAPWASYSGQRLAADWQRTQSRLHEMLSADWPATGSRQPPQ
jgi:cell division protein ZapE